MVKFLKTNKVVIILQGKYTGHKAMIVRSFDDGTHDSAYRNCLVAGIKKYPSKVNPAVSGNETIEEEIVAVTIVVTDILF
ncbi:hypothetical protein DKX38_017532 [Salix brachista]|uniref:Uncharacterized protein n=1 Tax=Salix brachista TaxID=2182728 RepID=A0A5N5KWV1_9ROSI|nr:hypothetical protein DKX38_017532 [Salix brachista]